MNTFLRVRLPVLLVAVSAIAPAQKSATAMNPQALQGGRVRIQQRRPAIPAKVLDADQTVLNEAAPKLKHVYANWGLSEQEGEAAIISVWEGLRVGPSSLGAMESLTPKIVELTGIQLGIIDVESDPIGVLINIDGFSCDEVTNFRVYAKPGVRKVTLSKPTYKDVVKDVVVTAGKKTTLSVSLKKVP